MSDDEKRMSVRPPGDATVREMRERLLAGVKARPRFDDWGNWWLLVLAVLIALGCWWWAFASLPAEVSLRLADWQCTAWASDGRDLDPHRDCTRWERR